jgi:hypothetical protein
MKIRPVAAEFSHVEGHTDRQTEIRTDVHDEDNSRFSEYCERGYKITKMALMQIKT